MPARNQSLTIQMDQPGTPRSRGGRPPTNEPGPVAEGAGNGVGAAVEPAKVLFLSLSHCALRFSLRRLFFQSDSVT